MTDEEKKVAAQQPASTGDDKQPPTVDTTPETLTEIIDVPETEVTGRAVDENVIVETTDEAQIQIIPYQNLRPGMVLRLHEKIKDITAKGERERVQVFQGIVMGLRGAGISKTVTIRKDAKGWMVEKIFPLASPHIEKIEVVKQLRVRRAKLSFLKGGFKRKIKEIK